MKEWLHRVTQDLEPVLLQEDPRPGISAYHDMPFAIFRYAPADEFGVREQVSLLRVRLEHAGKRVTIISLAECMYEALAAEGFAGQALIEAEVSVGLDATIETIHQIMSDYQPLDDLVIRRFPPDGDARRDVVFIVRAGVLFPFYRTSSLLEQLRGGVDIPAVLFYPGELDGAAGLRFMGVLDAEHNYRPRIF